MTSRFARSTFLLACVFATTLVCTNRARAESTIEEVLTPLQQRQSEQAVAHALAWLALQQRSDGSFPAPDHAQPAVTGLCVLAFLSRGDLPGQGTYGPVIDRGINYILSCSQPSGVLCFGDPEAVDAPRELGRNGIYNHAIGGLALSEAYGMADRDLSQRIHPVLIKARDYTVMRQRLPKKMPKDIGGWRYIRNTNQHESDMSVTSWQMLFLRSAKNAGFAIRPGVMEQALDYVERSFDEEVGTYVYIIEGKRQVTRAMAGAGILSMSLAGKHETPNARAAGEWLLARPFDHYRAITGRERYFYGIFYCSQAMFQLGGKYWREFFPGAAMALVQNQSPIGSWDDEQVDDGVYGNAYITAFCVLTLETPRQILPIFQR